MIEELERTRFSNKAEVGARNGHKCYTEDEVAIGGLGRVKIMAGGMDGGRVGIAQRHGSLPVSLSFSLFFFSFVLGIVPCTLAVAQCLPISGSDKHGHEWMQQGQHNVLDCWTIPLARLATPYGEKGRKTGGSALSAVPPSSIIRSRVKDDCTERLDCAAWEQGRGQFEAASGPGVLGRESMLTTLQGQQCPAKKGAFRSVSQRLRPLIGRTRGNNSRLGVHKGLELCIVRRTPCASSPLLNFSEATLDDHYQTRFPVPREEDER